MNRAHAKESQNSTTCLRRRNHRVDSPIRNLSLESPPAVSVYDADAASVDDSVTPRFTGPYVPPPLVTRTTVLCAGLFVFLLAMIWPPLILLFAYIASKLIPYSFRENDDAATRRELYKQFCQEEDLPERFKEIDNFVHVEESYWSNARGLLLSTCIMTPKNTIAKAVVCYCHGYTDHASFSSRISYQRLCEQGIAVVSIEYEGHGRSDGPFGLINDWDTMVDDVSCFFAEVTSQRFQGVPAFLMGESMGGAVAYDTYNRNPSVFRGVVFVCPMCKISDDMLPPQYVIDVLKWLIGPTGTTSLFGFLPIAPAKNNLSELVHRIKEKGELSHRCPLNFSRNPRLATARELINVTQRISETVSEFEAPFLVLHGLADRVTDPNLSKTLYNESCSTDKDIRLYKGMWHGLTSGEPDENIDRVFGDVASWIADRL